MEQFIYIITDSNRACLHVGLTDDISNTVRFYKENKMLFFNNQHRASRLVYYEKIECEQTAMKRFKQLSTYTRPQKERLIRSLNADWRDLSPTDFYQPGAKFNPKVPNLTSFRWNGNA